MNRTPTLLVPADTYDLVTLAEARDELKIDQNDTSNDAWLARAITQVSDLVQDYCKRQFAVETWRDRFDLPQSPRRYLYHMPSGLALLQLSHWPIICATSVTQKINPDDILDLVQDVDFATDTLAGQLTRFDPRTGVAIPWEAQQITVVYDSGFYEAPPTVVDATLRLVVNRWHSRGRDPLLLERVQPLIGTERFWVGGPKGGGTLPSEVQGMLDMFRVPTGQ